MEQSEQEQEQEDYLSSLANHAIFNNSSKTFTIINQNQLILAVNQPEELRLLSLNNYKSNPKTTNYKILRPRPAVKKPITSLLANPSSRLLAICAIDQVAVLSLPRTEDHEHHTQIDCQATVIGHSNSLAVKKVLWHPWSHRASTLLILYDNGILHEYDVSRDALNPAQIIDFNSPYSLTSSAEYERHPSLISSFKQVSLSSSPFSSSNHHHPITSKRASSSADYPSHNSGTYGSEDKASSTAISICFGTGTGDWGPLTLYAIMMNGDMYAICPYLPKNAVIPLSYRNSLLFFLTAKLESITSNTADRMVEEVKVPLERSLDYLNSLSDVPDTSILDEEGEEGGGMEEDHGVGRNRRKEKFEATIKPVRQGPFLMTPSPIETNENEEETVSDLLHFRYSSFSSSSSTTHQINSTVDGSSNDGLGVFMIAYQTRIDVCLEVEKIEPKWTSTSDLEEKTTELPTLVTYECIDLDLTDQDSLDSDEEGMDSHRQLKMKIDERYQDTIYVSHRLGVDEISIQPWIESLIRGLSTEQDGGLSRIIQEKAGSLVTSIVQLAPSSTNSNNKSSVGMAGLSVIDDAYLGYCLMALTNDSQLIPIQLKHRPPVIDPEERPDISLQLVKSTPSTISMKRRSVSRPGSILGEKEWKIPRNLLESNRIQLSKPPPSSSSSTSNSLKYAKQISTQVDDYIRSLVESINSSQDRLQLQIQEFIYQIRKTNHIPNKLTGLDLHLDAQFVRIKNLHLKQKELLKKADVILQALVDFRNRDLSREEIKWFSELNRMKIEIFGPTLVTTSSIGGLGQTGTDDRVGLCSQIAQLKKQLGVIKASLRSTNNDKEGDMKNGNGFHKVDRSKGLDDHRQKIGESQLVPIRHKLEQAFLSSPSPLLFSFSELLYR
ncbi:hypothetical protein MJO28_001081 [Puccinia striiformis f. sp. tritici]|uniref:Uncharacterized protein n=1 Tax=Puccinia striiformis f. sp. tritici TaxID=168172 RepID=A0ACC0EZW3_9BASI|nr:hypothetical protein Pst134EA_000169 [Puccinia striiformis f. sp. tritici]KAH9466303.1 hypothetical protein Pst134EB_001356 [Puccinia striiformis f. sp. tritici]KAH9473089.1 hypothetical protein Pst134EA_000169 [Puccinia striiformis f. sp. tritici]KAI7962987.1 hypothetical protein MJO28_001081 [Puccinia striiformis f. sp. tritici]KAI7966893.1 hypothetical protein MJO29_000170 [Puccinia striiformis f. sp. tritici]